MVSWVLYGWWLGWCVGGVGVGRLAVVGVLCCCESVSVVVVVCVVWCVYVCACVRCLVGVGWAGPTWPLVGMAVECVIVGECVVVSVCC